ncbi:MAG: hypothetical protein GX795_00795 [Firmicutes bacterium]|jgi:hypothetical protein|nr:hypothetical protein [Bacillota bacterium]
MEEEACNSFGRKANGCGRFAEKTRVEDGTKRHPAKDITLSEEDGRILDEIWADIARRQLGKAARNRRKERRKGRMGVA